MALPSAPASQRPFADVAVYGVQKRTGERHQRPWVVRWSVAARQRSRSFRTKAEADRFRTSLLLAQQHGEEFDDATGQPVSWLPSPHELQVHHWARRWVGEQWHEWAPRTRHSAVEAVSRLVPLAVASGAPKPPVGLRAALMAWLPPDGDGLPADVDAWLARWSSELGQLSPAALAAVDHGLGLRDDGKPLSPSTASRFRKVSKACIRRAVDLDLLEKDPWPPTPRGRSQRKALKVKRAVNVRMLPDPATMARVIAAIPTHQPASRTYEVMTAVAYYAGLRPSEVVMLRAKALHLPADGWGRIEVVEADIDFDEPGEPKTGPRSVPIPHVLVAMLAGWIDGHGFTGADLLFRTRTGGRPTPSNWSRALHRALATIGQPSMRIYDCRHAAATTWLRAGVPLGDVAKRLGHSVETLVSTYVGAIEGDEALSNERIDAALAPPEDQLAKRRSSRARTSG